MPSNIERTTDELCIQTITDIASKWPLLMNANQAADYSDAAYKMALEFKSDFK